LIRGSTACRGNDLLHGLVEAEEDTLNAVHVEVMQRKLSVFLDACRGLEPIEESSNILRFGVITSRDLVKAPRQPIVLSIDGHHRRRRGAPEDAREQRISIVGEKVARLHTIPGQTNQDKIINECGGKRSSPVIHGGIAETLTKPVEVGSLVLRLVPEVPRERLKAPRLEVIGTICSGNDFIDRAPKRRDTHN